MLDLSRDNPHRWFFLSAILLLFGIPLIVYLSSYQKTYLDYRTGQVRFDHIFVGTRWKTAIYDRWITPYAPKNTVPEWHLIGYQDQKLRRTMVSSKAGQLSYQIRSIENALFAVQADQTTRELVAHFVLDQINQPDDKGTAYVNAMTAFDCFRDAVFQIDLQDDTISYEQVLQAIYLCSDPDEPESRSP